MRAPYRLAWIGVSIRRLIKGEARQKICRWSGGDPELVKDALHGEPQVMVVAIDDPRVLRSAGGTDVLSGREQRFDGFLSEHE